MSKKGLSPVNTAKAIETLHDLHYYGSETKADKKTLELLINGKIIDTKNKLTKNGKDLLDAWFAKGADRNKLLTYLANYLK